MKHVARVALALALLLALPSSGFAAEFNAIVDSLGKRPLNAWLDVAVDDPDPSRPQEVKFEVFDVDGAEIAEFFVPTQNGFASTFSFGDLFDLANGQPILVRASTPSLAADHGAALHLEVRGAHAVVGVLYKFEADGTPYGSGNLFSIPLGSFQKATVLIANVSGSDVGVESFSGGRSADGTGTELNGRLASNRVHKVTLTQNDAFSNYIVNSTGLIIVQVVIDDGKTIQSYMVPPSN